MALEFGFYDSYNGDRRYNAENMNDIFEGVIRDGVYAGVGDMFFVKPSIGLQVTVGTGRAWFKSTWNKNRTLAPINLDMPDPVYDRIDTLCIRVQKDILERRNDFFVYKGAILTTPQAPVLQETETTFFLPLANIRVRANAEEILTSDIEILVGRERCPFVTSIIQQTNIKDLFAQWQAQFEEWWNGIKDILNRLEEGDVAGILAAIEGKVDKIDKATIEDLGLDSDSKWMTPKMTKRSFNSLMINSKRYIAGRDWWGDVAGNTIDFYCLSQKSTSLDWLGYIIGLSSNKAYDISGAYAEEVATLPVSQSWKSLVLGEENVLVAVASASMYSIYSNGDYSRWSRSNMPKTANWTQVTYGNKKFVAVSDGGDIAICTSDGTSWSLSPFNVPEGLSGIIYDGMKFIALPCNGDKIYYSSDALEWSQGQLPVSQRWDALCYGDGIYVACGKSSNVYSFDGINWKESKSIFKPAQIMNSSITYGNEVFIAVVNTVDEHEGSTYAYYYYTTNGVEWYSESLYSRDSNKAVGSHWRSVAYTDAVGPYGGGFVMVGSGSKIVFSVNRDTSLQSTSTGVTSFKGRTGDVNPQSGDYTAAQVGALPTSGGTLTGNLTIGSTSSKKNLSVTGTSTLTGNTTLGGTLGVTGNTTLSGTLGVTNSATFNGSVEMKSSVRLKGSGNYGSVLNFGDGDNVHVSEPTDDNMEIKANSVNFVLSGSAGKANTNFKINGTNPFTGSDGLGTVTFCGTSTINFNYSANGTIDSRDGTSISIPSTAKLVMVLAVDGGVCYAGTIPLDFIDNYGSGKRWEIKFDPSLQYTESYTIANVTIDAATYKLTPTIRIRQAQGGTYQIKMTFYVYSI